MMLSDRSTHAFKTALAVVIAYAIALSMNWNKPYWAGFVAASLSLTTLGQGIQNGLMATVGAVCGAIVGFAVLADFVQDRWLFIGSLSLVCALCIYLGLGTVRYKYFWVQFGFLAVLVGISGWLDPVNAFHIGIERTKEVATGLIVYTIIAVTLWPQDTRKDLETIASKLGASLHQMFNAYTAFLRGEDNGTASAGLRAQAAALQGQFGILLDAAVIDSLEVKELRKAWRRVQALLADLGGMLDRWRLCLDDLRGIRLDAYLPSFAAIQEELDRRLAGIERLLAGQPPEGQPTPLDLVVDQGGLATLSPFDQAAVNVARDRLEHLERTTRALFATLSEIRGLGPPVAAPATLPPPPQLLVLDRDRLAEALRVAASAWLIFLAVVYIPGLPGGLATVATAVVVQSMVTSPVTPNFSVKGMLAPVLVAAACTFPIYIFLMPALSDFYQLALVLFTATFGIAYVLHEPRQGIARSVILLLFMMLISVNNEQQYHFIPFTNTVLQWLVFLGLLTLVQYFPVSGQPDQVFPRMVRRLLNSSAYLLSLDWKPAATPSHWPAAFHRHEIATLPQKLPGWGRGLPPGALGSATPGQLQALVTSLQALSLRIEALLEARAAPQAEARVHQLQADVRTWRTGVQRLLEELAAVPEAADPADVRTRLDAMLAQIQQRIAAVVNSADDGAISAEDNENMIRLLGAYRGVSEGLIAFADHAAAIDWGRLREARF